MDARRNSIVVRIDAAQAAALAHLLRGRGWIFSEPPHAHWRASGDKVQVTAYESGKLTIQGRNAADFMEFTLEPMGFCEIGAGGSAAETDCSLHGGVDESGKGDFFGPLVIAGVCTDEESAPRLTGAGVCDSKLIRGSARIRQLAEEIRRSVRGAFSVVVIGPEAYNRLYARIGNLNRLLAWGHARVIENLLKLRPECPRMLSDQFASAPLIQRALLEKGRSIRFEQRVRAESDVAVAAASILARERFLGAMERMGEELGMTLPRGAGPAVTAAVRDIVARHGEECMNRYAKTHFRTLEQARRR